MPAIAIVGIIFGSILLITVLTFIILANKIKKTVIKVTEEFSDVVSDYEKSWNDSYIVTEDYVECDDGSDEFEYDDLDEDLVNSNAAADAYMNAILKRLNLYKEV